MLTEHLAQWAPFCRHFWIHQKNKKVCRYNLLTNQLSIAHILIFLTQLQKFVVSHSRKKSS